jgi:hypothetical protein
LVSALNLRRQVKPTQAVRNCHPQSEQQACQYSKFLRL